VGIITAARIEGGRLYVDAQMFKTERAKEVALMVDGGLRNVSVGYEIEELEEDKKRGVFTATRWQPLEVSIVTVPADASVGIGRAADDEAKPVRVVRAVSDPAARAAFQGEAKMADSQVQAAGNAAAEPKIVVTEDPTHVDPVAEAAKRREAINKLARSAGVTDQRTIDHWVRSGKDWDAIGDDIIKIQKENQKASPAYLDMPQSDTRRYSMWRAMNAVLSGDWRHAGLELEASQEVAKRSQRMHGAKGFFVPLDIQKRDLTSGTPNAGGYLVATENMSFIDMLRNRMVAMRMGATEMPGLQGNVTIPRQTAGATAYWLATEGTAITESQQTFGQLALTPKTVGAYVEVSRLLMMQSSPAAEQIVMNDLAQQVARAADLAVLHGSGSAGQPTGISATGSIGSVVGTSIDYAKMVEFQEDVASANVDPVAPGYVTTPTVAKLLKSRQRFTSTDTPLWQGNVWDGNFEGTRCMSSNQMNAGTIIFGDWSQVIIGQWGVLEVALNEQANFPMGVVGFRAFYTMDVGVRYAAAFSMATSVT
jgi:HK97 family phage major capsid protein